VPPTEVLLVAEVVSRSSLTMDRTAKRAQYAESGIPVYLVIDPFAAELAAFSDPSEGTYRAQHAVGWSEKLQLPEPLPALVDGSQFPTLDTRPGS
ncbi:Uma2 family endonuclease, partial [Streptomyces oceani]